MLQKRINPARQVIIDARNRQARREVWQREAEEKHREGMLRKACRIALGRALNQQIEASGMKLFDQWGLPLKEAEKQEALEYFRSIVAELEIGSPFLPS